MLKSIKVHNFISSHYLKRIKGANKLDVVGNPYERLHKFVLMKVGWSQRWTQSSTGCAKTRYLPHSVKFTSRLAI